MKLYGCVSSLAVTFLLGVGAIASAQGAAGSERGSEVFTAQKCVLCHSIAGVGNRKGPLDGIGGKLDEAAIRRWIVTPAEMAAASGDDRRPPMRAYPGLPDDELDALVAYLMSVPAS